MNDMANNWWNSPKRHYIDENWLEVSLSRYNLLKNGSQHCCFASSRLSTNVYKIAFCHVNVLNLYQILLLKLIIHQRFFLNIGKKMLEDYSFNQLTLLVTTAEHLLCDISRCQWLDNSFQAIFFEIQQLILS